MAAVPRRIVGIGASAGGLESLGQLFDALPPSTGMCFVVVQHLSPEFRSMMDELIGRRTAMPVAMADHELVLAADHVYFMPPAKEMIVRAGRLILTDRIGHTFTRPIDTFFRSLAQDAGPRSVAIVMSGSGGDGARGVVEIKRAGGLVFAESSRTARFDSMPRTSIETGSVDDVLEPIELAGVLARLPALPGDPVTATNEPGAGSSPARDQPADATPIREILALLRERFAIDFSEYKMTTVGRRIQRRLGLTQTESLPAYLARLRAEPEELDALYRDLLIGVTQFLRDPEAFDALEGEVIPRLLDAVPPDEEVRVWVAGCATGEEAYSIAMLLIEAMRARARPLRLAVLATDVHARSLETAAAGRYASERLTHVSARRLARFFVPLTGGVFEVGRELRSVVAFAKHDVTRDPPHMRMHLISCRNLLIYLTQKQCRSVLSMFHFALVPTGFLFLGASESPVALADEVVAIDDRWKLFQRAQGGTPNEIRRPSLGHRSAPREDAREMRDARRDARDDRPDPRTIDAYDQLLDLFMPPGFLVGEDRTLLDSFAGAERLLRSRPRRPSTNLLELLEEELRLVVGSALHRVLDDGMQVSYVGTPIDLDGPARCTVVARPLDAVPGGARGVVITFQDIVRDPSGAVAEEAEHAPNARDATTTQVDEPIDELADGAELDRLRPSQGLLAAHEQLIASHEELQTTHEELQSVNEQLHAIQDDNHRRIGELRETTSQLRQLLDHSEVGAVLLDRELRVRCFTPVIARVFRFQTEDIGRRIGDFAHTLDRRELYDELAAVIATGAAVVDEVRDATGARYQLRIAPYRPTRDDGPAQRPEGAILSLVEIVVIDRARRAITSSTGSTG